MDGVCASPCAHQFERSSARRRSFASGCGSIRLLLGAIASALPNVIPRISETQTSENTAPRRDFQAFGKPNIRFSISCSQMPPTDVRDRNERKNPQRVKRSPDFRREVCRPPSVAVRRICATATIRMLGARTAGEGTVLARAGFLYACFETALWGAFICLCFHNNSINSHNAYFIIEGVLL